jgi:hypothetical protein
MPDALVSVDSKGMDPSEALRCPQTIAGSNLYYPTGHPPRIISK